MWRRAVPLVAGVWLSVAPASLDARPIDDYRRLIAALPIAPFDTLREFAALPDRAIDEAVVECLTASDVRSASGESAGRLVTAVAFACPPETLLGAAMLHAESAALLMPDDKGRADFHIDRGRKVLSMFLPKGDLRGNPSLRLLQIARLNTDLRVDGLSGQEVAFVQRWYALVVRLYLTYGRWDYATRLLDEVFAASSPTPELLVARGLVHELPPLKSLPDPVKG